MCKIQQLWTAVLLIGATAFTVCGEPVESRTAENKFVYFAAPGATGVALSEGLQKLAVGFASGEPAHLWLLDLDRRGDIANAPPRSLELPESETADSRPGRFASMIFHSSRPVLYIWRHFAEPGTDESVPDDFDHLVVFDLSDPDKPVVAFTGARGELFAANRLPAYMGMDPAGRRLFVPDIQIRPVRGAMRLGTGYFPLDPGGFPLSSEGQAQFTFTDVSDFQPDSAGGGFLAANERVLLMSARGGVLTWDTIDRRAGLSRVLMPVPFRQAGFIGGDSDRVYWAGEGAGILCSMRHVEGYPTLLPVVHLVEGARFRSPPIRMFGDRALLAIGGDEQIHLVGLTPGGEFSGDDAGLLLEGAGRISALCYSVRRDRLYIPLDELP